MKLLSDRLGFIRFYTWWNYKLPPLFGIAFLFILHSHLSFSDSLKRLAVLIVCMIGTAGFGHYLNDIFDIESDRLAGKRNSSASHSRARKIITLVILFAAALLPWIVFFENGALHFWVAVVLLLFVLYSVPPFRLKDRGFTGVLADTLYAHALPSLVVMLAMLDGTLIAGETRHLMRVVFAWQFFVGFRNIAFHQFEDYRQDLLAGAKTWAVKTGEERMKKISLRLIHPLEVVMFLLFLSAMFYVSVLAGILLLAMIILRLYIYLFIYEKGYLSNWRHYFSFVNNIYEEDIPLVLLICLTLSNPWFVLIMILYCILFPEYFLRMQQV